MSPAFPKDALDAGKCSARCTGFIEAPLGDDFTFRIYTYRTTQRGREGQATGAKVRLWIDGKLAIDSWDKVAPKKTEGCVRTCWVESDPVKLHAGQLVSIKLEYSAAGEKEAHLHLYWESKSNDLRHVPTSALYPHVAPPVA
jgi:hypothetical protein